jgi:hypothetical protein
MTLMLSTRRYALLLSCLVIAVVVTAAPAPGQAAGRVTMERLLNEMVDMERLATVPHSGFESDQQSSYDRASVAPDKEGWFANGDAAKFIRQEEKDGRTEHVMAEMDGPGAVVRLWSANPDGGGTIRVYIDDLDKPALECDFLALTSAQMAQFPAPFSGRRSMGANLYFPLPYQKRCKVTVEKPKLYYQVGYRTYPPGTEVEPFSMDALPKLRETMRRVAGILEWPGRRFTTQGAERRGKLALIRPGEEVMLHDLAGPAAIVRLDMKAHVPEEQLFAALREPVLTIRFDGEPCVWAPLGDFFGTTPGLNTYESLPVGVRRSGMCYSNWHMPFGERATIAVRNDSADTITLRLAVWVKPIEWNPETMLYFRAGWRNEWLPADPRFVDWRMLDATGPGRFAGVMLGVVNTHQGWWGEGDEKVWVDDDTFPSYFGTGSEDYFGYAWCNPGLFTHAYHNQSIVTGPGNFGYTAVARYHVLDDIPFDRSMRFDIEKWAGADREYCCTTYWYAAPGAEDFFAPVPVEERRVRPLAEPFHVAGALEGEKLKVARCTAGKTQVQGLAGEFSYGRHLWWTEGQEGGILEVIVPVEERGRYRVTLGLTKSWDYGIHQVMVNGEDVGEPLDLWAEQITPLKVELGAFEVEAGEHTIGLRCVGTNPNAKPVNYMAGIDYILLEPAK